MTTDFDKLDDSLRSVRITSDDVLDVPKGLYVLDLLVARAVIEPGKLLADEPMLLDALRGLSELASVLEEGDMDKTSYLPLGLMLHSQERALKVIAALTTLHRGKMVTMRDVAGIMQMPELKVDYQTAVEFAERGYLSIVGVNLLDEEQAARREENEQ